MVKLIAGIIIVVFLGLTLGESEDALIRAKRQGVTVEIVSWDQFVQLLCQNNPLASSISICNAYLASSTTTTTVPTSTTSTTINYQTGVTSPAPVAETTTTTTTLSPSALQRAHWCSFNNGSYLALGQTFMYTDCTICQCIQSRAIRCTTLQCLPTFCIDNSAPATRPGQCCSQCAYEQNSAACVINGISFPDGAILEQTSDNGLCWCQLGTVECRKFTASLFSSLNYWGPGTAAYVIVIVICVLLIVGTLLCMAGALCFYYYYQRTQARQQAYDHYYNSAGWQPMGEDGQVVDPNGENKDAEAAAAQNQNPYEYEYPTGNEEQYIPPPYALYNGAFLNEQPTQEQKQI